MDRLPASQATFEVDPEKGLTNLDYEFAIDDMSEVLAGLRAQQPQRPGLGVEHRGRLDHCSEVRKAGQQAFLMSVRPSRLRPGSL